MSSIFKWFKNFIFNTIPLYLLMLLFAYILMSLYCYIFKISQVRFIVYYIYPIFDLISSFINIIITVASFPYYITKELFNIFMRIFGIFTFIYTFILTFIINIGTFFINLTSDVYLVS